MDAAMLPANVGMAALMSSLCVNLTGASVLISENQYYLKRFHCSSAVLGCRRRMVCILKVPLERGLQAASPSEWKRTKRLIRRLATRKRRKRRAPQHFASGERFKMHTAPKKAKVERSEERRVGKESRSGWP